MRLLNKTALVTGAADGLGLEISRIFLAEGARLAMLDRNGEKLESSVRQFVETGLPVVAICCDVGTTEAVDSAVARAKETFGGRIDILVNNAAVAVPGDITEQTDEEWNALLNINLLGAVRCIRAVLPCMLAQGSGSVIGIGSLQGERSWDHWTAYAAAKGGIRTMTRQLAGQYGPQGVRFNSITPGAMITAMSEARRAREGDAFYEAAAKGHALGRMGRADEICGAAVFLASDEASFVTGADLLVDGGAAVLPRS